MDASCSLPLNVALITLQVIALHAIMHDLGDLPLILVLQELDDGNVLLRLAHLYE
ncbi:unnamed protein product, partial [Ilex paraguariensis]